MQPPEKTSISGTATAIALIALGCTLFSGCSSFKPRQVAPISNVIGAAESGQSSSQILSAMDRAKTTYALRGSDFAILAQRSVPDPVLDELQQRFFSEIESLTRRWYERRLSGGPIHLYPQPLDLDNLKHGGNGMAATTDVGKFTSGTRPPGVPEWVPPYPSAFGKSISVNEVLEMSQSGTPVQEIVETIRNSHVKPIYASTGFQFSRLRVGAITGSMFASLASQGVDPEVLNALQAVHLADHIEISRIRYNTVI